MKKSFLVLLPLIVLTGVIVFIAMQPYSESYVDEPTVTGLDYLADMTEDARMAIYNARSQVRINNPRIGFSLRNERNMLSGGKYFQYNVLYNGVRIQARFLVIHTDDYENVTYVSLSNIGNISLNTRPVISQAEAEAIFMAEFGGNADAIAIELVIHPPRPAFENRPEPEHADYRLAWHVSSVSYSALIDANSGEIVFSDSNDI